MSSMVNGGNCIATPPYIENVSSSGPAPPANGYVAEDGVTYYVAEDGATYYVQEV